MGVQFSNSEIIMYTRIDQIDRYIVDNWEEPGFSCQKKKQQGIVNEPHTYPIAEHR